MASYLTMDEEKCRMIKLNGAALRLHMVVDHILKHDSYDNFDHTLIQTGIRSLEGAIAEYASAHKNGDQT